MATTGGHLPRRILGFKSSAACYTVVHQWYTVGMDSAPQHARTAHALFCVELHRQLLVVEKRLLHSAGKETELH